MRTSGNGGGAGTAATLNIVARYPIATAAKIKIPIKYLGFITSNYSFSL
jgi:hypothetical protein